MGNPTHIMPIGLFKIQNFLSLITRQEKKNCLSSKYNKIQFNMEIGVAYCSHRNLSGSYHQTITLSKLPFPLKKPTSGNQTC
jgi:hypothetical protein